MAPVAFPPKPVLKYINLRPLGPIGGRGGAVRLYMIANKIEFDEELVDFAAWRGGEKERVKAELNPLGHLPVTTVNGRARPEAIATLRYMATKCIVSFGTIPVVHLDCGMYGPKHLRCRLRKMPEAGQYGTDPEADWDSDAAADAYQEWRNAWATTLREDEDSEKVQTYLQARGDWYAAFEWYYARRTSTDSPYLAPGGQPGFADAAIFNMVRDDIVLHGQLDIDQYPSLKAAVVTFGELPEVRAWVRDWKAREE